MICVGDSSRSIGITNVTIQNLFYQKWQNERCCLHIKMLFWVWHKALRNMRLKCLKRYGWLSTTLLSLISPYSNCFRKLKIKYGISNFQHCQILLQFLMFWPSDKRSKLVTLNQSRTSNRTSLCIFYIIIFQSVISTEVPETRKNN